LLEILHGNQNVKINVFQEVTGIAVDFPGVTNEPTAPIITSPALMMKKVRFTNMPTNVYLITRRHMPEEKNLHRNSRGNLKSRSKRGQALRTSLKYS
jgi:hypothetical protein